MVLAASHRISPVPRYSGYHSSKQPSMYRTFTPYGGPSQIASICVVYSKCGPTTPARPRPDWFGLFPFRSPLLRESLIDFFSSAYLDVSVQQVRLLSDILLLGWVAPFGHLRIKAFSAAPRSFSQPDTSFFAFESLGIHHTPLFAF